MMGRRQRLADGDEVDYVYCRHSLSWRGQGRKIKRRMNKRFRRELKGRTAETGT